jgi:hypothetical protein
MEQVVVSDVAPYAEEPMIFRITCYSKCDQSITVVSRYTNKNQWSL